MVVASRGPITQFDNEVQYLDQLHRMYVERNQPERSRMQDSFKFYSSLDNGQWPKFIADQHIAEHRQLSSFNFIQNKINALAGTFLQSPYDSDFSSRGGTGNNDALFMKGLFLSDKELGGWEYHKAKFLLDGLIHMGVMEMGIDYSRSPLGNIALYHQNPFAWYFDPNWVTDDVNDNKAIIKTRWMDAEEIRFYYPNKISNINEAIDIYRVISNSNSGDTAIEKIADRSAEYYDSYHHRYKVIQVMTLRKEAVKQLWNTKTKKFVPFMDPVNTAMMKVMMNGEVEEIIHRKTVNWVKTICPALSVNLLLEDAPHPLRLKRYPLFVWSSTNMHGERQGFVDILKDLQMTYNFRESAYTHFQTAAANGSLLMEANMMDKPERERFIQEKGIPGSVFIVKDGSIVNGRLGLAEVPRGKPPEDMVNAAQRAYNMSHDITPTPPAVTGGEGKSGESAKLLEQKREIALTSLTLPNLMLQKVDWEIADTYFDAAQNRYAGAPREFTNPKTGETWKANIRTLDGIENDISKIDRMNIVVTRSKVGYSVKKERVNRYIDVAQYIKNPIMSTFLEGQMIDGMDGFTDEEIATGKMASAKWMAVQIARADSELANAEMTKIQANQMKAQMGGQQPGMGGTPSPDGQPMPGSPAMNGAPGGYSVEGKKMQPGAVMPVDIKSQSQMNG